MYLRAKYSKDTYTKRAAGGQNGAHDRSWHTHAVYSENSDSLNTISLAFAI